MKILSFFIPKELQSNQFILSLYRQAEVSGKDLSPRQINALKDMDIYKRPIHCSDAKREVLYIKNNDEWIKETDDKPLIKNAIKRVAFKNIRQINEWVKENPTCKDTTTKKFDQYNKIVMNSMSGGTVEEQHNNMEQIVKNITKAVVIDKYAIN